MAETLAFDDLVLRPKEIWRRISFQMSSRCQNWKGLNDKAVIILVVNVRTKQNGKYVRNIGACHEYFNDREDSSLILACATLDDCCIGLEDYFGLRESSC